MPEEKPAEASLDWKPNGHTAPGPRIERGLSGPQHRGSTITLPASPRFLNKFKNLDSLYCYGAISYDALYWWYRVLLGEHHMWSKGAALCHFKGTYVASKLHTLDLQCHSQAISYFLMRYKQNTNTTQFSPYMANQIWQ